MTTRRSLIAAASVFAVAGLLLVPLTRAGAEAPAQGRRIAPVSRQEQPAPPPSPQRAKPKTAKKFLPVHEFGGY